jgi:hypothetical protein
MTKVPTPEHRIVLTCKCGHKTEQMTQEQLDQFGTPWYCPSCGIQMLQFAVGLPDEFTSKVDRQAQAEKRLAEIFNDLPTGSLG